MKSFNISKKTSNIFHAGLIMLIMLTTFPSHIEASKCRPSGRVRGQKPRTGQCNTEDDLCCVEGKMYKLYKCSPPVTNHTRAYLTLNSFEGGGDGRDPAECDNRYHSNDSPVVALSTGWFNHRSRCLSNITITAPNGRSVVAMVVDECDSTVGCEADHDYQPPCANNIVEASLAVWKALRIPREDWGGLDITWSHANS